MLKAIGNTFLFRFMNDTYGGKFVERSQGQIILTNQDLSHQANEARWVKVVCVGKEVESVKPGDIVLVEALKWTIEMKFEGQSYWKSDEQKVIAIADDETVTYAY